MSLSRIFFLTLNNINSSLITMRSQITVLALSAILIASIGVTPAFAQIEVPVVFTIDKSSYAEGETIVVSGEVKKIETAFIVGIQVFEPNSNNIVYTNHVSVGGDRTFSDQFTAGGPLWVSDGEYRVFVMYGTESRSAEATFSFGGSTTPKESQPVQSVPTTKPPLVEEAPTEEPTPVEEAPTEEPTPVEEAPTGEAMPPVTDGNGGCLIATATFGSELAPQVQQLREIRDNSLLQTESGSAFMESFNQFYYSFSPTIADLERENPVFKEAVKLAITPLLSSLSLLNYVNMGSEVEVLGYGISLILLNVGMYFVAPAIIIYKIRKN